ncbi:MAG: Phosphoribosyl-ATP pyrophosphatase [Alphaproteobacteria bacterium ADurb.Bin438]|nr:MAG: Phosphoribosyl-ATP pyrophosphatase [Alphaproteobacteria bacterium ADurb.Bin438]
MEFGFLSELEQVIETNKKKDPSESYTAKLFYKGLERIAQKVGEEAVETVIASMSAKQDMKEEAADLIYHLLVLLNYKGMGLKDIVEVLEKRHTAKK